MKRGRLSQLIITSSKPDSAIIQLDICNNFWKKLKGLMFKKHLPENEGVIFSYNRESRLDSAIHMFFMNFDIAVLWLDQDWVIVDKTLAKRWRPFYMPKKPAHYVLELHPSMINAFKVGDKLTRADIDNS